MTAFETKDSGEREEYVSGMRRDVQQGKARFDLLIASGVPYDEQFLTRLGELLARGAEKYGERNWELADSAEELARFKASALRHMMQWQSGEVDEDHMAAVAFNLMAAEYVKWKMENAQVNEATKPTHLYNYIKGKCSNPGCRCGGTVEREDSRVGQERDPAPRGLL